MLALAAALDAVNRLVGLTVRWLALALVLVQFVLVLLRYVFGVSSIAASEAVLYIHATLFMLGAGYAFLVDGHVRVDIFYAKLSARGRAAVDMLGHLALLFPALAALALWSWPMVRRSWAILEGPISVGGIPASFLLKSLIPAFCVLLAIQGVALLLRDAVRLSERAP
jgi:TRAP-type mannitol/chloroaromatic compound transport system permease small subunit